MFYILFNSIFFPVKGQGHFVLLTWLPISVEQEHDIRCVASGLIFLSLENLIYSLKIIRNPLAFLEFLAYIYLYNFFFFLLWILICGLIYPKAIHQMLTFMGFTPFFQFVSSIHCAALLISQGLKSPFPLPQNVHVLSISSWSLIVCKARLMLFAHSVTLRAVILRDLNALN